MENRYQDLPQQQNKHDLEESIWETFKRDLVLIATKTRYAVLPFSSEEKIAAMRDCKLFSSRGSMGTTDILSCNVNVYSSIKLCCQ